MIGKTISHYKIIEKIGEGGMGIVYKALDLKLDRFVALKFLPAHMGKNEDQKLRFINEAKAASALDHPNICTIYEINETEDTTEDLTSGRIFIAMAYYDGNTLEKKIVGGTQLPIDETISTIMQIAQGLKRAHEKGIVHRDIKPANIVVPTESEAKIVDFGLAKLKGQPKLTKEESTLGTIAYMSPEQARGTDIDAQTDIWSLGIIFYEMLTGKSPFGGDYEQAVIYNILNDVPEPVNNLNKDVPAELNDVIQKCLEKEKDKRYQTIPEFNSALLQVIKKYQYTIRTRSGEFQPAGSTPTIKKISSIVYATIALIAVLVITGTFIYWPESEYTDYEEAYFTKHFEESRDLSKDERSISNIKANRYYILSTAKTSQGKIPEHVKQEYRDLLVQNPDSPQAYYYLGLIYSLSAQIRAERDSVWICYDRAENLGMKSIYLKLDELIYYTDNGFSQQAHETVKILLANYPKNPEAMFETGYLYFIASDTSRAKKYYNNALALHSDFVSAHLGLFRLSFEDNDVSSAKFHIENAADINSEYFLLVRDKVRLYEKQGRFDEAEKYLNGAINDFGGNDIRLHKYLASLFQKQDLFEKCNNLISNASKKFPNDSYFSNLNESLKKRIEWIRLRDKHKNDKKMVQWSENYEESLVRAAREEKPVFIEFYATNSFWSKDFEEKIYPDPRVQDLLKSYIPLRLNAHLNIDLANKYRLIWFPALQIIDENGEKLKAVRYYANPPSADEFITDLQDGLVLYKKYIEGKSVKNQQITEVSNIDDAILLSGSKKMPVMALVLSKESKWSNKLLNEAINSPILQNDLKNVILVKVDHALNRNRIKEWNINYFPSIIFLNDSGKVIYQIHGYQPPKVLANLITDLKFAMDQNIKFKERIKWFYDLEEAKIFATLQKKDIFVFANADWCPYCRMAIEYGFTDQAVIEAISDKFIAVELDDVRDAELLNSLGINMFPTFLILDDTQQEIIRLTGWGNSTDLTTALDLDERKPIYSILGYEKYKEFYNYENLSEQFFDSDLYLSAIHAIQKQIEIYPDNWQSYYRIGNAYRLLKNSHQMVSYYTKAIDKGAEIDHSFAETMLNAYLQLDDQKGFEKWIRNALNNKKGNSKDAAMLFNVYSEYYEILMDRNSAIDMAKQSVTIQPNISEGNTRLGRLYFLENKPDKATSYLTKALQLNERDPLPCFYLGLIAGQKGDIKEKERYFKLAGNRSKRAPFQVSWRTKYESRQGYFLYPGYLDLIEQAYSYALKMEDMLEMREKVNIKNNFAYFLALENRRLKKAMQLVDEALKAEPDDITVLDTKAIILYQQGKYKKAHDTVLQYEDQIKKDDLEQDPTYSYYIGRIKWAVDDTISAKKYFKYALKQTEPDVRGERNQRELIKFMAEHNLK